MTNLKKLASVFKVYYRCVAPLTPNAKKKHSVITKSVTAQDHIQVQEGEFYTPTN